MPTLPDSSVSLIITDPPHSDRIPYLELSELWNTVLGECPPFESEIVVSNAKERRKTKAGYNEAMSRFLEISAQKLAQNGFLVVFFNARTEASWRFFQNFSERAGSAGLLYSGSFPLCYSAASVVQDNRDGALRTDHGLVFSRSTAAARCLTDIPGWTTTMPAPNT
jgi:adenine-specific DNA methylase